MFLDVEGSQEYFGHKDGEHFDLVKEQYKVEKGALKSYRDAFRAKAKAAREARDALVKGKAKGSGRGGGGQGKGAVVRSLPDGELQQADLAPLVPLGGHIWRGNKVGAWSSHLKPFRRFFLSWHVHGHRWSAVLVLRDLWTKYLLMDGETEEQWPIQGLFA
ncbi:hypothetical protein N9L19_00940 [bacterium]|nr:hypothetical protein [bacterium]